MMSFGCALMVSSLAAFSLPDVVVGAAFRGRDAMANAHGVSNLLEELEKVTGREHRMATEGRVNRLEQALMPMFAAMPKDSAGRLDPPGVRYMLHRLFVQRHGWFVEGLDSNGDAWNSSSPAAVFKDHSGEHHSFFDDKLDKGFTLHQVAVFAATLEALVHTENSERLKVTYRLQGLSESETLTEAEAEEAIRGYMVVLVRLPQGTNISAVTRRQYDFHDRTALENYETWPDTVNFAKGVRHRIVEDMMDDERTTWDTNLKVVEEIGERYGRWQAKECHVLKSMLMALEKPGTGRVLLKDFYGPALENKSWNFVESVPYLRQLGALDESDAQQPSVIIPNYLNAPTNCVASSKFYSVCCIDECEDLLSVLERQIAEPDATPAQIADIVAGLPSDTVQAPRVLPAILMSRLEEIANHHNGRVPLHGRLFAQWMHHAYPRECQYPHVSGTTNPVTQEEWLASSDHPLEATPEDMKRILQEATLIDKSADMQAEEVLPWHAEEELFVSRPHLPETSSRGIGSVGRVILMSALGFAAYVLSRSSSVAKKKSLLPLSSTHKYYV